MANDLVIYTVEDADGNQFDIEGPAGATPDQLQEAIGAYQQPAPASTVASSGPSTVSAPNAPAKPPVSYIDRPGETVAVFGDEIKPFEGLGPEFEKRYADLVKSPNSTGQDFSALVKEYSPYASIDEAMQDKYLESVRKGEQTGVLTPDYKDMDLTTTERKNELAGIEENRQEDRSAWERFGDNVKLGFEENFGGLASRGLADFMDEGKEELRVRFPGQSEDWYENMAERAYADYQKNYRGAYRGMNETDPASGAEHIIDFAGQMGGGILSPETIISPGKTVTGRILGSGAVNAASDLVYQTADNLAGVEQGYDAGRTLLNAAAGAAVQGVGEGVGAVYRSARGAPEIAPEVTPDTPATPRPRTFEEEAAEFIRNKQEVAPTSLEAEAAAFKGAPEPTPETLWDTPESLAAKEKAMTEKLEAEAAAFKANKEAPEAEPTFTPPARDTKAIEDARVQIAEQTAKWKNAPDYEVVNDLDEIADPDIRASIDPDAIGVVLPDGNVIFNLKNIDSPATLRAAVFHEMLGHHGLTQQFGNMLDNVMTKLFDESPIFREKVEEWMEKNPNGYIDSPNRVARAADEVFAEWSERQQIPLTVMNKLKNYVKQLLRKAGVKDVAYSQRELETILAMAQDATINGKRGNVAGNGFRFSAKTSNAVDDIVKKVADFWEISNVEKAMKEKDFQADVRWELEKAGLDQDAILDHPLYQHDRRNGPRYMKRPPVNEERRAQIKAATERLATTKKGETKTTQPFPEKEPDYWRFRHVTDEDKAVTGFYHVEDGKLQDFSVDSEGGPASIGPKAIRQIGRDLLKQHPEASRIEGFRISGARPQEATVTSGNRFMVKKKDTNGQKMSTSPEKMRTVNDVDDLLDFLRKENESIKDDPVSIRETERAADDLGLTASKFLKGKDLEGSSAYIRGAHQLLTNQVDELAALGEKLRTDVMTPSMYAQVREKLAVVQAVYAKFDKNSSEVGRALRQLREISESKKSLDKAMRYMTEAEGSESLLQNPEALASFIEQVTNTAKTEGPAAAANMIRKAKKFKTEDYVGSFVYNMMLSSPKTWMMNAVGAPINFMTDLASDGMSSLFGQGLKQVSPQADRVFGREMLARLHGPIAAFTNYNTWKNTFEAFKTGESTHAGLAGKIGQSGLPLTSINKGLGVIETPQRIMAGIDEFWAGFFQMSNLYGEAAKKAAGEGKTGSNYWQAFRDNVDNPTPEMLRDSHAKTNRQLFRDHDNMSKLGKKITDLQRPRDMDTTEIKMIKDEGTGKMVPTSKQVLKKSTPAERVMKFGSRLAVPFVPTIDSIARTIIRNSGPGALASGEIRGDILAGGVRRQSALARIALSTSVMTYWMAKAAQGELTGTEDPDYRKGATEGAVKPPMSIKIGDEWVSYRGLDPIAGQMVIAANLQQGYSKGQDIKDQMIGAVSTGAQALKNIGYAESLSQAIDMLGEATDAVMKGEPLGNATQNFAAGYAATVTTPAAARYVNQKFVDPAARDTTGDDSFFDRVSGRIKSGVPGLSDDLPQKYDVFGREMKNLRQERNVETDPVAIELARLEDTQEKVVIGPVGSRAKVNGEEKRLNAEEFQAYQQLAGNWLLESVREEMNTPEWQAMTDEEKVELVKEIRDDMRKAAREELFAEQVDEEEAEME